MQTRAATSCFVRGRSLDSEVTLTSSPVVAANRHREFDRDKWMLLPDPNMVNLLYGLYSNKEAMPTNSIEMVGCRRLQPFGLFLIVASALQIRGIYLLHGTPS
jgi:hypothetical protein